MSFIKRLDPSDRAAILRLGTPASYRAGAHLFIEGDVADQVGVVVKGCVKILGTGRNGRHVLLALRDAGDLVGLLPALEDPTAPRASSAVAVVDVVARIVPAAELQRYLLQHPQAMYALVQELGRDLGEALRQGKLLSSHDTLGRVVARLVELADRYGEPAPDGGVRICLHLSQADVAAWIGGSREAVVRALASLRARGLIATQRRAVVIHDLEVLRSDACTLAGVS
jgi:CRP/FNR family transcriptional regulator, cyclic AMP receptor protein